MAPREGLLRQALLAQLVTAGWMVVEGAAALAIGIRSGSVALTAFGIDSAIEIFSAVVVYRALVDDACTGHGEYTEGERAASRMVGWALRALMAYVVASSAFSLLSRTEAAPSTAGIILALAVLVIMPGLWLWRRGLAERLDNPGLRGDVACSVLCIWMAITLLAGLVLNRVLGWWWADPLAGLAMLVWIRGEAAEALEAARTGRHCDC